MKLIDPTDEQLDAAFAEKVAGWRPTEQNIESATIWAKCAYGDCTKSQAIVQATIMFPPQFTRSMDAVLPWLENHAVIIRKCENGWHVTVGPSACWEAGSLPSACVIALLRAHGVEVEFTK